MTLLRSVLNFLQVNLRRLLELRLAVLAAELHLLTLIGQDMGATHRSERFTRNDTGRKRINRFWCICRQREAGRAKKAKDKSNDFHSCRNLMFVMTVSSVALTEGRSTTNDALNSNQTTNTGGACAGRLR